MAADRDQPHLILVGLNRDNPELHDAYMLDVRDGSLDLVAKNPGFVSWLIDRQLRIRGGIAFLPDGGAEIRVGDPATGEYRTLLAVGPEDTITTDVVGFTHDGAAVYLVTSKGVNAARLLRMDVETGDFDVLAEDPIYDVSDVEIDPATHEVQVVTFMRERADHVVLDDALRADLDAMRALHPGDLHFNGRDHADRIWILGFTADDGPVSYFAFDRATGAAIVPLRAQARPRGVHARRDGAVLVHVARRARGARLPDVPARLRPLRGRDRALRPRRPVGARRVGL